MKKIVYCFFLVLITILQTGCALIFYGNRSLQNINVDSRPEGASFDSEGKMYITPAQITLNREQFLNKAKSSMSNKALRDSIVLEKEGYPPTRYSFKVKAKVWCAIADLGGFPISILADGVSGALYRFPNSLIIKLDTWQQRLNEFVQGKDEAFEDLLYGLNKGEIDQMSFMTFSFKFLQSESNNEVLKYKVCRTLASNPDNEIINGLINQIRNSNTRASGYIAICLGMIGEKAKDAIPELIKSFPTVSIQLSHKWGPFVLREDTPTQFEIEASDKDDDDYISRFQNYIINKNQSLYSIRRAGSSFESVRINTYKIQAGAWALSRITKENIGTSLKDWENWYNKSYKR